MTKVRVFSKGILLIGVLMFAACGGSGSSGSGTAELTLKYPGADGKKMPVKSGGFYSSTKTFTSGDKRATSPSHFICLADHDIDMSRGSISIGKALEADNQTKVCFSIDGEEGGKEDTPVKIGTYSTKKSSEIFVFNTVTDSSIRTFSGGKEARVSLNNSKWTGDVKINSVSGDTISGEVNLNDGEKEIKGTFTAQAYKRK